MKCLDDPAGLWAQIVVRVPSNEYEAVGIFGWTEATPSELDTVGAARSLHQGPLLAVLRDIPTARGARACAKRLDGIVLAETIDVTLRPALEGVQAGLAVIPIALRELLNRPALSVRERQILALVVLGCNNQEVSARLFVTESSVKGHLTSAFKKLGVTSRGEAVALILDRDGGLGPGILRISARVENMDADSS